MYQNTTPMVSVTQLEQAMVKGMGLLWAAECFCLIRAGKCVGHPKRLTGCASDLPAQRLGLIICHSLSLLLAASAGQQPSIVLAARLGKVQGTQYTTSPVPVVMRNIKPVFIASAGFPLF